MSSNNIVYRRFELPIWLSPTLNIFSHSSTFDNIFLTILLQRKREQTQNKRIRKFLEDFKTILHAYKQDFYIHQQAEI